MHSVSSIRHNHIKSGLLALLALPKSNSCNRSHITLSRHLKVGSLKEELKRSRNKVCLYPTFFLTLLDEREGVAGSADCCQRRDPNVFFTLPTRQICRKWERCTWTLPIVISKQTIQDIWSCTQDESVKQKHEVMHCNASQYRESRPHISWNSLLLRRYFCNIWSQHLQYFQRSWC